MGMQAKASFWILFCLMVMVLPRHLFSALPEKETRAYETLNIPTVDALDKEEQQEKEDLFQLLKASDLVFHADLNKISVRNVSMAQLSIPMTFMTFREIKAIQGALPSEKTFRASQKATLYQAYQGKSVLVMLNRIKSQSKGLEIAKIVKASKQNLSLARHAASLNQNPSN